MTVCIDPVAIANDNQIEVTCAATGTKKRVPVNADGSPKQQHGWKIIGGRWLSPEGIAAEYVRRIIVLPILKPADPGVTWNEFGAAVDEAFREGAKIGNLAMRMFSLADCIGSNPAKGGKVKLPPWKPDPNATYAACRVICPDYPTGSVSDLLQRLRGIYQHARFEMLVTVRKSLPSFTRGRLPLSLRKQDWQPSKDKNGNLFVSLRLGSKVAEGIRGQRLLLQLRRGNHHAHAAIYESICSGDIESADAKLKKLRNDIGLAVTVMLPRKSAVAATGALMVRTSDDSLLVWNHGGDDERPPLNAMNLKKMLATRTRQNQQWSDDLKYEKRWPTHVRRRMNQRHDKQCRKWNERITGFNRLAARLSVNFAKRRNVKRILYDDSIRTFAPLFAWHELSAAIASAAALEGIDFVVAPPAEVKGDQGRGVTAPVQSPERTA